MGKSMSYRQYAAECRSIAQFLHSDEQRSQLLNIAEAWDKLAADTAKRFRGGNSGLSALQLGAARLLMARAHS